MSRPRELLLGALLVGVAGALRLFRLDALPFSEAEAARALTAASLLSGQPPGVWTEPALHAVSALTAFLFGLTDNALRLAPAFSGTAAVALLWLYRPMLGAVPTLAAQALLALSPTMIASSRTLSAEALAQPLLLLLVWCGLRFAAIGAGWALSSAAVCAGLLLNLGPAGISCLLALSLAPAVAWTMGRGVRGVPPTRWVEGLVAFLIAFTLGASGLLLNPQGFGAPALRAWAAAFEPQPATGLLNLGALKLGVYETAVLFAGVPAAVWAFWRVRQAPAVLPLFAMWAAGGLLLLGAMGDRGAWTLLPAALPLTVLAGAGLGKLLEDLDRHAAGRAALAAPLVALVLTYMALAVLRMSGRNDIALPLLLGATALAAGAVIALAPQGGDPFLPRSGAALVVFALAVGLNLHSVSRAAFSGGAGEWLDTARPDAAAVDALRGLPLLPRGAPAVYTDEGGLAVASDVGPLARWYLYDRAGVSFLPTLQPGPALMLGMRPADGQPAIQGYTVRDLPLDAAWRPSAAGLREWWRWYVLRETFGAAPQERRAVLYQRT